MTYAPSSLTITKLPWWRRPFARGRGIIVPLLKERGDYWQNRCRNVERQELVTRANWQRSEEQLHRSMVGLRAIAELTKPEHALGTPESMLEEIAYHVERVQMDVLNIGAKDYRHV